MKTIKILTIILALLDVSSNIYAQEVENLDSFYNYIVLSGIAVYDTEFNLISDQQFRNLIFHEDTVINCFHAEIDEFVNTNFYPGSLTLVRLARQFDTSTNRLDYRYLTFSEIVVDEDTGIFKWKEEKFNIRKEDLEKNHKRIRNLDKLIFTNEKISWKVESMNFYGKTFILDSCHLKYSLRLDSDGTFKQRFGFNDTGCRVEVDSSIQNENLYFDSIIKHNLSVTDAIWLVKGNTLYLYQEELPLFEVTYFVENGILSLIHSKSTFTKLKRDSN